MSDSAQSGQEEPFIVEAAQKFDLGTIQKNADGTISQEEWVRIVAFFVAKHDSAAKLRDAVWNYLDSAHGIKKRFLIVTSDRCGGGYAHKNTIPGTPPTLTAKVFFQGWTYLAVLVYELPVT